MPGPAAPGGGLACRLIGLGLWHRCTGWRCAGPRPLVELDPCRLGAPDSVAPDRRILRTCSLATSGMAVGTRQQRPAPVLDDGTELREGCAAVGDQGLHYVEAGDGPLVVLLHGFPEFWFGWRLQIAPLVAAGFRVVAPDPRGYNLSSKPEGFEDYGVDLLADDIRGLIEERGAESARLVGTTGVDRRLDGSRSITPGGRPDSRFSTLPIRASLSGACATRASCAGPGTSLFQLPGLPEHLVQARFGALPGTSCATRNPPYTPRGDPTLHRGVVATQGRRRDDQLSHSAVRHPERVDASFVRRCADAGRLGRGDRCLGSDLAEPHPDDVPTSPASSAGRTPAHSVHHGAG